MAAVGGLSATDGKVLALNGSSLLGSAGTGAGGVGHLVVGGSHVTGNILDKHGLHSAVLQDNGGQVVGVGLDAVDGAHGQVLAVVLHDQSVVLEAVVAEALVLVTKANHAVLHALGTVVDGSDLAGVQVDLGDQAIGVHGVALHGEDALSLQGGGSSRALLYVQSGDLAVDHSVKGVVLAAVVLVLGGRSIAHHEGNLLGGVALQHGGLNVNHLGHVGGALKDDSLGGAVVVADVGYVLDTGVDHVVIAVLDLEDGLAVGVDSGAVDGHSGLAGLNVQVVVGRSGSAALVSQSVDVVAVLGVGNNVLVQRRSGRLGLHLDHLAVGEQQLGVVGGGTKLGVILIAHHEGVVAGGLSLADGDHVALSVQIEHYVLIHGASGDVIAGLKLSRILIGLAIHHEALVGGDLGHLAGDLAGGSHGLDLRGLLAVGKEDHIVHVIAGSLKLLAVGHRSLGQVGDDHIGLLVLIHVVLTHHRGDLAGVGVYDGDDHRTLLTGGDILLGDKDLHHGAVAGTQQSVVVALGHIALGEGAAGGAVQVDGPGVLVGVSQGLAHGVEQLLAGDLAAQYVVGLVGGNHDLLTLVVPGAGGTGKGIGGDGGVDLQAAVEELLAQLNGILAIVQHLVGHSLGVVGGAGDVLVLHIAGNGDVAHDDGRAVLGGLNHGGLQGVQSQLSHIVAGQSVVGAGVDVLKQVNGRGLLNGGDLPVAAEVGAVLEVAQSLHHHQAGLHGGNGIVGAVGGGAGTAGHAGGIAGGHIGTGPLRHISKGDGSVLEVLHLQTQQIGHHNGHLGAGDLLVGVEVSILIADHHANGLHHGNGLLVVVG